MAYGYLLSRMGQSKQKKGKEARGQNYEQLAERCRQIFFPPDEETIKKRNDSVPWEVWECVRAIRDIQLNELGAIAPKIDELPYGTVKKLSNYLFWAMMNSYFISLAEAGKKI